MRNKQRAEEPFLKRSASPPRRLVPRLRPSRREGVALTAVASTACARELPLGAAVENTDRSQTCSHIDGAEPCLVASELLPS